MANRSNNMTYGTPITEQEAIEYDKALNFDLDYNQDDKKQGELFDD